MRFLILLIFIMTAIAAPTFAQDNATGEKALRDMWSRFEKAFNNGDAKTVAGIYARDGDRVSAAGVYSSGREETRKQYQGIFDRRKADASSVPFHAEIKIRFLRPDVALLDGTWTGQRAGKEVKGTFTVTATKEKGTWLIAAGRDRGVIDDQ